MINQTCKTCRWSEFQMTDGIKPRIKQRVAGKCLWPVPPPVPMPLSITGWGDAAHLKCRLNIWPDYQNCPVWEGKPKDQ